MWQWNCVAQCGSGTMWLNVAVELCSSIWQLDCVAQCSSWTVWLNVALGLCD